MPTNTAEKSAIQEYMDRIEAGELDPTSLDPHQRFKIVMALTQELAPISIYLPNMKLGTYIDRMGKNQPHKLDEITLYDRVILLKTHEFTPPGYAIDFSTCVLYRLKDGRLLLWTSPMNSPEGSTIRLAQPYLLSTKGEKWRDLYRDSVAGLKTTFEAAIIVDDARAQHLRLSDPWRADSAIQAIERFKLCVDFASILLEASEPDLP